MTRITYAIGEGRYTLEAEGHSGFYPGNDIVCAAVSALLQTCWAGLMRECRATGEKRQESGKFFFRADVSEGCRKEAETLLRSVVYGLKLIEREFPQNVKIIESGGGCKGFSHGIE